MTDDELACQIRVKCIEMISRSKGSHIGGCLSIVEILVTLYNGLMVHMPSNPDWIYRDRFILSKGHCCAALYATLALEGYFDVRLLNEYGSNGSKLMVHASSRVPGVEFSTGSLGHGLPLAVGKALAAKSLNYRWNTYVLMSDGELNEGSNWEAIQFAAHHKLNNLVAIVDVNGLQSLGYTKDVLDIMPLLDKFLSFGWHCCEVDGHNVDDLHKAMNQDTGKPLCILAKTVKGKGVSFMEDKLEWHYKSPDEVETIRALEELTK